MHIENEFGCVTVQSRAEGAGDEEQHHLPGPDGGTGGQGRHPPGLTALHQGGLRHQGGH